MGWKLVRRLFRKNQDGHPSSTNRRMFTRVPVTVTAQIFPEEGPPISGHTANVCMAGLYLACDEQLPVAMGCQVTLLSHHPAESSATAAQQTITARGKITRRTEGGMGVELTAIVGKDSFERLRSLLLQHATEAEHIEGEIQTASWSYTTHARSSVSSSPSSAPAEIRVSRVVRD